MLKTKSKFVLITCIFISLFFSSALRSQVSSHVGIRLSEGFIIAHSPSMDHLKKGHSQAIDLSYVVESNGKKEWHKLLRYPRQGLSFYHLQSGNSKEIGSISSLYGYLDFPLFKKKRLSNYFKFGSGITYVQHNFDRVENFRNVAIGSTFNLGFVFANHFEYNWQKLTLGMGLSLVHSSSGAFKIPNLGLNISSVDFTLAYKLATKDRSVPVEADSIRRKNNVNLLLTTGPRAVNAASGSKYFIHTLQAEAVHRSSSILSYGLGFDLFYNEAVPFLDLQMTSEDPIVQVGGKLLVNLHLDRATLFVQVGNYLLSESKLNGPIYNRFGGRYTCSNNVIFNFSLKTHLSEADYFEAGIGYSFR